MDIRARILYESKQNGILHLHVLEGTTATEPTRKESSTVKTSLNGCRDTCDPITLLHWYRVLPALHMTLQGPPLMRSIVDMCRFCRNSSAMLCQFELLKFSYPALCHLQHMRLCTPRLSWRNALERVKYNSQPWGKSSNLNFTWCLNCIC